MTVPPNTVLRGPVFPEPVQVIVATTRGAGLQIIGRGLNTNQVYDRILTQEQIGKLSASPETEPFDGSPRKFRLGIEALRLGLAYEYDSYFSLSIARMSASLIGFLTIFNRIHLNRIALHSLLFKSRIFLLNFLPKNA